MHPDTTIILLVIQCTLVLSVKRRGASQKNCILAKSTPAELSGGHAHDPETSGMRSLERKLQLHLLRHSHPMVRPVYKKDDPVVVTFGFSLIQIVSLDEHRQSIHMKIWLRMKWINEFMKWDPADWGNITHSRIQPHHVWTPDIFLEEDVGAEVTSGLHSHKTSVIIHSNGQQQWMVPEMLQSACRVDVTSFPFDQQKCKLVFTPWTHNQRELDMLMEDKEVLTKHYVESSEWTVTKVTTKVNSMTYICCPVPYVNMEFVFTLQRRPLYYIHNLMIPCILQIVIILSTFFLPLESGERVGVVITIILVFAVYLQVVRESLPESSSSTPLLSKFFVVIMALSACLLISTCFILKIHFKGMENGVEPVPRWAKTIFIECIGDLLYIKHSENNELRSKKSRKKKMEAKDIIHIDRENLPHDDNLYSPVVCRHYQFHDDREALLDPSQISHRYNIHGERIPTMSEEDSLVAEVRLIKELIQDMNGRDDNEDEWTQLAKVLDRLCFVLFFLAYAVVSFVMLLPAYLVVHNSIH